VATQIGVHEQRWISSEGRQVQLLVSGARRDGVPDVQIVPGLGAVGYMLEFVHACGAWTRTVLLDLPGFGDPAIRGCPADLDSLTPVAAGCLADASDGYPVVLVGHSTGAQLALRAAVAAPERVAALVLVGITFEPSVRASPAGLLPQLRTYVWERPRELLLTLPDFARAGRRLPQYVASALQDRPEDRMASVGAPVLVLRGHRDTLCPLPWARQLAARAHDGEARTLPGSHNVPYTHPGAVALHVRGMAGRVSA
jgi:pimeloyl-ACP methyl ester carboxylesterase